jgi:outer membrane protein assembly factor BamB
MKKGLVLGMGIGCAALFAGAAQWPSFRGPQGDGIVDAPRLPLHWDETNNVVWKTAIPQAGWSTPVTGGGRVWVTGATQDGHDFFVYGVDAATGKIAVERKLFHCDAPEPLGNSVNGYASPSSVMGDGCVFVHFGAYGTACLNAEDGATRWAREDFPCRHYRGPGSSPILHKGKLILTFDGVDVQYVVALDANTGKTLWKTDRATPWTDLDESGNPKREGDFRKAFSTPLVIEVAGREQLVSPGSAMVYAYDPETGAERWRVSNTAYTPSLTPVFDGARVYCGTGRGVSELLAIRVDGAGDVTGSHVAWRMTGKDVPLTPSPVLADGLLYTVSDAGAVTCLEPATGKAVWRDMVGGSMIASPLFDGRRLYIFSGSGKTTVLKPGRAFEVLAENKLSAGFMASPAVEGDALILRTKTHLYKIEGKR